MISLKWKIQLWHAAILGVVLTILGVGYYFNERAHRFAQLDTLLDQQLNPIIHATHVRQGLGVRRAPRFDRSPPARPEESDVLGSTGAPRRARPSDNGNAFLAAEERHAELGFYCVVWDLDTGAIIHRSTHAPADLLAADASPVDDSARFVQRFRDDRYRELWHNTRSARFVLGIDIRDFQSELSGLKWRIAGVLLAIFVVAVIVGGWLVALALAPLRAIQQTTAAIARGDLKQRIPERSANTTELAHLTHDLNDTFGKLDALFQRQVRFTADASHELRTPLTALMGHLKTGRSRPRSVVEHEEILETCERSARRIQRITDDLLELSRYDSGNFVLECEPLPLEQLLACLADDLQPVFAEHGSSLTTEFQPVTASCDPFRLEQVITNLINNALQHNPSPIHITLRLSAEADAARIDVIDNGKGIQPENLERLFDRFFQESGSRTKSHRNLNIGLGLSISKAIMEAHGGSIRATSEPGKETVFSIWLPLDLRQPK